MTAADYLLVLLFGTPLFLLFLYLFFRLASSAVFKSWKEHFRK